MRADYNWVPRAAIAGEMERIKEEIAAILAKPEADATLLLGAASYLLARAQADESAELLKGTLNASIQALAYCLMMMLRSRSKSEDEQLLESSELVNDVRNFLLVVLQEELHKASRSYPKTEGGA